MFVLFSCTEPSQKGSSYANDLYDSMENKNKADDSTRVSAPFSIFFLPT